jgi:hypothetical protein
VHRLHEGLAAWARLWAHLGEAGTPARAAG